jgi:hypothetical protein
MALTLVSSGNTIYATDIDQIINVLQQPSGGTEAGSYYITGNASNTSSLGYFVSSLSRVSSPVSVSINTSITSPSNCNSPSTDHLNANGFHVYTTISGGASIASNVGGGYTIQY